MASENEPDFVYKGVRYTLEKTKGSCNGCAFDNYSERFEACIPDTRKCDSPSSIYRLDPDPANLVTYRLTK